jgi:hypothetical protein
MKRFITVILALILCSPIIVKAQSFKWDSFGTRQCYWTSGTDLIVSVPSRLNEIRECTKSLIDAINNLFQLKEDISHEREMRRYSDAEIKDMRTDLEALSKLVGDLRLEIAELRIRARSK